MRTLSILIVGTVLLAFLPLSGQCQTDYIPAKIELKSSVDRSSVPLNQNLTLTVQASWEGEQRRFSITPIIPPQCDNLEIFESSSLNESKMEQGKTRSLKTFQFVLKPLEIGTGRIGPVQVNYIDNLTQDSSSLSTHPIQVQITPSTERSRPGYKPVLIIAILLVLAYVVYSSRKRVKRIEIPGEKETDETEKTVLTPEEKAIKGLDELSEQAQTGRSDNFSTDIYRLLTGYLESKYQIVTSGKTTDNIISSLSSLDLSTEKISLLREVLSTCDRAKFAGERWEKEKSDQILNMTRKFLEQNR
jgi:hypothetical protein